MAKATLRVALALGFGLMLSHGLVGCAGDLSDDDVVATVNGNPITVGYMELKWAKLADKKAEFDPTPTNIDSVRREVLDVIINKELMVDKAKQEDYISDEVYLKAYEDQKNYRLIELLKNKEVVDKMPEFTEEDLQAHYKYVGLSARARHIDVDTEEEAEAIHAKLAAGEISFADAVTQYSTHNDRERGGDMGAVSFGSNIKTVEDVIFNLEPGQFSEPVQTPYGWSLFIVDDLKHGEPEEYIAVRESIKSRLEMRAMREIGGAHAQRVLDKYGFEFDWDVAKLILAKMPDDLTPSQAAQARSRTEEKPVLKFSEEELGEVLYRVDGEEHDLKEFSDEYDRLHPFARPQKAARLQGIYNYVHKEVVSALMVREAKALELNRDPEFVMIMKEFEEQSCIGAVRRALVNASVQITDEDLHAFYDENPLYYTLKPQVRCKQIVNADEEKVREAWRRLEAGEDVDEVGRDASIVYNRQWVTDWFSPDSTQAGDNVAIQRIARLTELGQYTEPFSYQGYWGIMVLFETMPSRLMTFEEARDRVTKDLRELKENERLDSLLSEWREGATIEINEGVLKHVEPGPAPNPNRGRF